MLKTAQAAAPRVLIVDDEPANIQVLAEALPGFALNFATSAARALELALESSPDLILLDVVMPGMDGFDCLRWLKAEPRTQHIPVIFVTAMTELEDEERGFALGAVDYILKPISPAIVRARVRTHIELKRQRDLLEEHAAMDGLTGIANRRRFDQELSRSWHAAQRNGLPLTLMLLDVDHFKRYNDYYGHSPGDECLRRVAGALHATFSRGEDLAARYGGEEFALLLTGSGGGALQVQRALDAVHALQIPHARSESSLFVSISIGAVTTVATPGASADAALTLADGLLYAAKHGGRDRGEVHDLIAGERSSVLRSGAGEVAS
ncbi:MAG: diguanylate cyclase [Rhodanobacteraceae bacterium]|nr:diguanylate cyclase [Rhodanobacteraceae bacterium]